MRCSETAQKLGFTAEIRDTKLAGEVTGVAEMVADAIRQAPPKSVLLWGGETTVEIKGKGEGRQKSSACGNRARSYERRRRNTFIRFRWP